MSPAIGDAFAWTCPRAEARDIRPLFRQSHQTGATLQSHRHARPRHAPSKGNDTERMRHSPMTGLGKNPHPSCILLPAWVFLQRPLACHPPATAWECRHCPLPCLNLHSSVHRPRRSDKLHLCMTTMTARPHGLHLQASRPAQTALRHGRAPHATPCTINVPPPPAERGPIGGCAIDRHQALRPGKSLDCLP